MKRRDFIKTSGISALIITSYQSMAEPQLASLMPTPDEIEGPFYPIAAQKDKDFDLTSINGHAESALGKHIFIQGKVVDVNGHAIEDATVDLWQANAAGRYAHPRDPNKALIDNNFQGWAIVQSGHQGQFKFKTVFPGAYPVGNGWIRPPHIYFKVYKQGYKELITQMYFPGQSLNDIDRLLQRKNPHERELMIAKQLPNAEASYEYVIILDKA